MKKDTKITLKEHLYSHLIALSKTKDIDQITVKELTQHTHISRSNFYNYYSNISDLIDSLEYYLLSEFPSTLSLNNEVQKTDDINIRWIKEWFSYYQKHQEELNMLLGVHGHVQFHHKLKNKIIHELNIQMNLDGFPDDAIRKYFQSVYAETFLCLAMEWTMNKYDHTLSLSTLCTIASALRKTQ